MREELSQFTGNPKIQSITRHRRSTSKPGQSNSEKTEESGQSLPDLPIQMANHIASTNPGVKPNENLGKILIKVYTERQLIHQPYLLEKITNFGSSAV